MELKDKKINVLGDSITEGSGASSTEKRFADLLSKDTGAIVRNYGIGGTRFARRREPHEVPRYDQDFCGRFAQMDDDADIIVVYGGVNDYIHGDAPIGSPEDKTPATFWGASYFLMNLLKTEYADKTVVFMTPARAFVGGTSDTVPSPNPNKKPDAMPLLGYVEIIKERARQFDIPVLDLYHGLGIDPNNADERVKYTVDGLHFNDAGQAVLAKRLGDFLKAL